VLRLGPRFRSVTGKAAGWEGWLAQGFGQRALRAGKGSSFRLSAARQTECPATRPRRTSEAEVAREDDRDRPHSRLGYPLAGGLQATGLAC